MHDEDLIKYSLLIDDQLDNEIICKHLQNVNLYEKKFIYLSLILPSAIKYAR